VHVVAIEPATGEYRCTWTTDAPDGQVVDSTTVASLVLALAWARWRTSHVVIHSA
jgi:hypothetical protein